MRRILTPEREIYFKKKKRKISKSLMLNRCNTFHKGCATGSVRVTCQESNGWTTKDAPSLRWLSRQKRREIIITDTEKTLQCYIGTARGTKSTLVVLASLPIACTRVPSFAVSKLIRCSRETVDGGGRGGAAYRRGNSTITIIDERCRSESAFLSASDYNTTNGAFR